MNFESAFLGPQSIQVCHLRSKTPLTAYVDCHVDPTWTVYLQITPPKTSPPQFSPILSAPVSPAAPSPRLGHGRSCSLPAPAMGAPLLPPSSGLSSAPPRPLPSSLAAPPRSSSSLVAEARGAEAPRRRPNPRAARRCPAPGSTDRARAVSLAAGHGGSWRGHGDGGPSSLPPSPSLSLPLELTGGRAGAGLNRTCQLV